MNGSDIIGALLRSDPLLTARVPAERIKGGRLPADAPLDAVLVRFVSGVERHPLVRRGWERRTDRIAATVRARTYEAQDALIELVREACAGRTGDIGGAVRVAIRTAGLGPDLDGPGDTYEQTQDFRVSYDAPIRTGDHDE